MTYTLSEASAAPHEGHFRRVGRGGRGNFIKSSTNSAHSSSAKEQAPIPNRSIAAVAPYPSTTTPATTATTSAPSSASGRYTTGRGGVGNVHSGERPMFFFDEELERIYSREGGVTAPVIHIGRAGFGNRVNVGAGGASGSSGSDHVDGFDHRQRASDDSQRSWNSNSASGASASDGVWTRLSQTFNRGGS